MNRQETAIGNGSRWLDGLGGPGRAALGLSPVLVTEIFRCPMSALDHGRDARALPPTAISPITQIVGRAPLCRA